MAEKNRKEQIRKSGILAVVILILGGTLRFVMLGSVPGGMHQDEAFVAWNAFAMLREGMDSAGHHFPVYMADWGDGHSALYVWLLVPLFALSGGNITPALSRFPQAAVSFLTLWAVYCLMKRLLGTRAGLWGLALLAVCPWHIMMSRWGLDANLAPGFLIFGLYFFVRGLEREQFLLLSGLFYGLSLYCYAVVWPIVPFMLILQTAYCVCHKKLRLNRWSLLGALILFLLALPLILFLLVNSETIPEIALPFLTIPRMGGYRGSEVAFGIGEMWENLRNTLVLLGCQNTGNPYDFLLPWGLFYDIGRVFMVVGAVLLLLRLWGSFRRKVFAGEFLLFAQLAGGGLCGVLVSARMHQINCLFIPLVLCEAYGVWAVGEMLLQKKAVLGRAVAWGVGAVYLVCLILFQVDYYTEYRQTAGAYFGEGLEECVDYAWQQCQERGIGTITVEKGAQWPRLLLYTQALPSEYLETVVYDVAPAPASFETKGIRVNTRINYDNIDRTSVYILYFTDTHLFEDDFTLTKFHDWYVAVP